MDKYSHVIRKSALFQGIAENELSAVLQCLSAKPLLYGKNEFVFRSGDAVSSVGMVLSGSVHIIKEDFWGNRTIIAKFGEGELFGEAFSCAQTAALPVSVVAVESSEILLLDYNKIVTTCSSACPFHTRLISSIIKILAGKNILLTRKMEHITQRSIRKKLLSYLSEQAIKAGNGVFQIAFSRQQLADYLSVDRSALSNELCKMRDEGILEFERNRFKLNRIEGNA